MSTKPTSQPYSQRYLALVLATLAFALCFSVWSLMGPLAPQFEEMLNLSATQVGFLVAVPVILGSLARIPMGVVTDRYGGRLVFTALMLFLLIPVVFLAFANSYAGLLLGSFWLGLAGASFAIGIPFVARWFPPEGQGLALGVYGMGNIGTAIASFAAPQLSASYGWPVAFWVFLPVLVVGAVVFWLLARDAPGPRGEEQSLAARLAVLRENHLTWAFSFFYFITFGGFVAISLYLPTLLVQQFGLSKADAGARAAGFVLLATAARPVGGYLADRLGGVKVLTGVFLAVTLLAIVLAFDLEIIVASVVFLAIAASLGLGNGAVFKLVPQHFPQQAGTVTGLVGAAGGLGGFFPPLVLGVIRDNTGGYAFGFLLLAAFALFALALNLFVSDRESRARQAAKEE